MGTQESRVYVWDVTSGKQVHEFEVEGWVESLAFIKDSKSLVVGSFPVEGDGAIHLFDLGSGQLLWATAEDLDLVRSLAFNGEGRLLTPANITP